ncbi:hypothetical protein PSH49_21450 [Pseudoalteromonas sp. GABNS16G]|uniref:hypothetical protein n=1 Tax=Pseudoalteromonas sp. GABNS16G TaxID=3025324 RepID=UPI0023585D00|nr:hypothetical protein [Pseudoalteromonas sp. GABNS16G]MDC9603148.1 hypothetical protein [Pseudoalteromonas sp. GABNS16G]
MSEDLYDGTGSLEDMLKIPLDRIRTLISFHGPEFLLKHCRLVDDYIAIFKVYPAQSLLDVTPGHIKDHKSFKDLVSILKLKNRIEDYPQEAPLVPIMDLPVKSGTIRI